MTAEVFDLVQYELHRRKSLNTPYCSKSPFSSRLICGECGGTYGAKIWDSNNKYRREIYQCNHRHGRHSGDGLGCKTPHLTADEIKGAFIGAFNSCIKNRREIINNCITAISEIPDTSKLEKQEHLITDFDTGLWNAVIETMTICSKEHIVFKFKGGTEIKWSIV